MDVQQLIASLLDARISDAASSCKASFVSYLLNPCPGATRIAKEQQAQFNLWAANIGVFALDSHGSLDKRLEDSDNAEVRQMVTRLLAFIVRDLQQAIDVSKNPPLLRSTHEEKDSPCGGSESQDSSASSGSSSLNSLPRDVSSDHYYIPAALDSLLAVRRAVDQLHLISRAIRKASFHDHDLRASKFSGKNAYEQEIISALPRFAHGIIKARHSAASDAIVKRLAETMVLRRKKLLYSRRHHEKRSMVRKETDLLDHSMLIGVSTEVQKASTNPRLKGSDIPVSIAGKLAQASGTQPSKFDLDHFRMPTPSRTSTSAYTSRSQTQSQFTKFAYPPPPAFTRGQKFVECPYCLNTLATSKLSDSRWGNHVKLDLEPYICIFEDCSQGSKLYRKREDWLYHIQIKHVPSQYVCGATKHEPMTFLSQAEYEIHVRGEHPGTFTEAQLPILSMGSAQPVAEIFDICPLCNCVPVDVGDVSKLDTIELSQRLQIHIEKDLISLATYSVTWMPNTGSEISSVRRSDDALVGRLRTGEQDQKSTGSAAARKELKHSVSLSFEDSERKESLEGEVIDWAHVPLETVSASPDQTLIAFAEKFFGSFGAQSLLERPQYEDPSPIEMFEPTEHMGTSSTREGELVVPWHPDTQLNYGVSELENSKYFQPPGPRGSTASHSTVVNDFGDADNLTDVRPNSESRLATGEIVAHSGARFPNITPDFPTRRESDISVLEGRASKKYSQKIERVDQTIPIKDLGQSIRLFREKSANGREEKQFVPIDALEKSITRANVQQELIGLVPDEKLDHFTAQIWEVSPTIPLAKSTTRRKIFAILALMGKTSEIVKFIREDVFDNDLPFSVDDSRPGSLQFTRKGDDGNEHVIKLFLSQEWLPHEIEFFYLAQWEFLAPYFQLSTKQRPKIKHYVLQDRSILPFIETGDNDERQNGGFSDVTKIKIHPAHHNYCDDSATVDENPSFALKCLRHNSFEAFRIEVENLKQLSPKNHTHLIKLLVTFSWREQYYLLFPWADGNLLDFWKRHPEPSNLPKGHQMAIWFSKQCLGLAEGLNMIHTSSTFLPAGSSDSATPQIHGRHGDLKPENILWFKSHQDTDPTCFMGILKISDFGLTRFHQARSKSQVDAKGLGMSPTYRAPEYDVGHQIAQSYDIWTFGCVLLEFVTWYLLGWEEVDAFSRKRTENDDLEFKQHREDTFFNYVKILNNHGIGKPGARAKNSVADEFSKLYEHEECFDFMRDLLFFIEKRLLRMAPTKRADCKEIVMWFTDFHKKCSEDTRYSTQTHKRVPDRAGSDLSLISASAIDFTVDMDKVLKRFSGSLTEHNERRRSDASNISTSLRPQSPSRKVHFEQKKNSTRSDETPQINQEMESALSQLNESPTHRYNFPDQSGDSGINPSALESGSSRDILPPQTEHPESSDSTNGGRTPIAKQLRTLMTPTHSPSPSAIASGSSKEAPKDSRIRSLLKRVRRQKD